jgi:hypothetical protein
MELLTKEIEEKLQSQYRYGAELDQQVVVCKIFNAYGEGAWYLVNQNPDDADYLWAIVDLNGVKMGEVSKSELEGIKVPPFNLPLEMDMNFKKMNAYEIYKNLQGGKGYEGKESVNYDKNVFVSDDKKEKIAKMKEWVRTSKVDGVECKTIIEASKRLKVSVSELLPYIKR